MSIIWNPKESRIPGIQRKLGIRKLGKYNRNLEKKCEGLPPVMFKKNYWENQILTYINLSDSEEDVVVCFLYVQCGQDLRFQDILLL
jgi:hypothetical protein